MQMEPTAVKEKISHYPALSAFTLEVRAGTFCEWEDWLCSGLCSPYNLLVGSLCTSMT